MSVNVNGGALEFDAVINASQFNAAISSIEKQLLGLTKSAEQETKQIDSLVRKTTLAIATYASFASASNFLSDIVKVRGEFQQLEVAFRTMLGNKEQADKLLAQATDLAARTPFTLQDVGNASKQLLAYGFASDQIVDNIRKLGDVAAGVGAPLGDIVYLYGTLRTQGRAYTKDIQQFTGRGIPLIRELAKQFGIAEKEVLALVESGKVGFPEVEKAINSLTSQGGVFFNLMEEQSKTLTGLTSNLGDAWSRMLNDIGKSNEGVFAGAIRGAIDLVENYQTVLDVLKVLVATYGTYRAAIILTNATTTVATSLTKGWTVAQLLQYNAMVISERAMKILNATMLSNPAVAIASGIALLTTALLVFGKTTEQVKGKAQLLSEAQGSFGEALSKNEPKLKTYVDALKRANLTEEDRLKIYNKIKEIDPSILNGIDAKKLSYDRLKESVDKYLDSLRRKRKEEEIQRAIDLSKDQEEVIQQKIQSAEKLIAAEKRLRNSATNPNQYAPGLQQFQESQSVKNLKQLNEQLEQQKRTTAELSKELTDSIFQSNNSEAEQASKRTVAVIQGEIKALQERRDAVSTTSAEYKNFTSQIRALEKELEAITGKETTKAAVRNAKQTADDLKQILEEIRNAEEDARRSGMAREESEIDRINKRYEDLKVKVQELKIDANRKGGLLQRIENARSLQVSNTAQKQEAEDYKKFINEQKALFDQLEEYKVKVGLQKAQELTNYQTAEYEGFIEFLKDQLALVSQDKSLKGSIKKDFLIDALSSAEKERSKAQADEIIRQQQEVIQKTITFNIRRKQIEENYQKELKALRSATSGEDLKEREKALKEARDQEIADLENSAIRQSGIYRKLNQDIVSFTREQLKQRVKDLKATLENDISLTPQMKADLKSYIEQLQGLIDSTGRGADTAAKFFKLSGQFSIIGNAFRDLGSSVEEFNAELADTLNTLGDIAGVASNAFSAIAQFASGNIVGGIGSTIQAISGIFQIGSRARASARQAQKEIEEFNLRILQGEVAINEQYRERERQQARLNKLKLQGLQDEKKLLEEQKKAVQDQYNSILKQLQEQSFIVSKTTERYGGVLGIGRKTRATDITAVIGNRSFEDLEKLFNEGRLEGKAKELFQLLQQIKKEGADIDTLLKENAEAAKQIFTGTTADSITDTIADGFKNGLRSAQDFAKNFEELMQSAILNALKYQTLEGPLKEFYDQFAANAESDNILTDDEVAQLRQNFNEIIQNAGKKFEELQKITNVNFNGTGAGGSGNSLTGAIKGITEQQADLLAGQFGGLRLTAIDQLKVAQLHLTTLQNIELNTSHLLVIRQLWERIELNGLKVK